MRILVVDGFASEHSNAAFDVACETIRSLGHTVEQLTLRDAGFCDFMSEAERRAYERAGNNLVTEPQRRSAGLVRSVEGIVICCPFTAGSVPPVVKSWFERTFVPGVAFELTDAGKLKPGLGHLRCVAMIVECERAGERSIHGRDGSGRAILRGLRLAASRRCRSHYVSVKPNDDVHAEVVRLAKRWPENAARSAARRLRVPSSPERP